MSKTLMLENDHCCLARKKSLWRHGGFSFFFIHILIQNTKAEEFKAFYQAAVLNEMFSSFLLSYYVKILRA